LPTASPVLAGWENHQTDRAGHAAAGRHLGVDEACKSAPDGRFAVLPCRVFAEFEALAIAVRRPLTNRYGNGWWVEARRASKGVAEGCAGIDSKDEGASRGSLLFGNPACAFFPRR